MANLAQIYDWFMTGKKPTQAQFWASWGSFWNKEESIPQSAISNLTTVLNAKTENDQFNAHKTDENAHADLFNAKEDKTNKGVANGYTPLDSIGKVPKAYLKDYVYNTFFVDTIDGDDRTAEFENPFKPYYSSAYVKTLSSYNENKIITIIK